MADGVLAPGQVFAGYRIEGVVGRGGMGVVYRARDEALERTVALKLVVPELAGDARFRERFLRESRAAASLEHPHALPVHAAGEQDGALYLVMRFVEGEDLQTLLDREGPLPADRATALLTQVAGALDAAHGKGLVHRDVKPGNVLIAGSGEVYLCDFGLTKLAASDSALTRSGELLGTLDYLAPEQIEAGPVDGRVDQYSLACVLFECLIGRPPFRRETPFQLMWAHMQEPPPLLAAERPDIAAGLDTVMARGMAKEPEARYGSCGELMAAARAAVEGETVTSAPVLSSPGFVGRDRELGELLAGLDHALAGNGRLFLIGGEPGIGKSRLADELTNRARARGARVLVGRCWEAGGAPAYWPWLQALRSYVREGEPTRLRTELGAGAPDLAEIVPELRELMPDLPPPPALDSEGARFRLFDSTASFLRRAAGTQPLVLALDDLHAADTPSLLLLQFVARELAGSRILIVGAYRTVDPTPADSLTAILAELAREPVARTISLPGLAEREVARFIEVTSARSPSAGLVATVYAETEGNPLFVGEVVRLLEAEGGLDDAAAPSRLTIPPSLKDVIGRRLHQLSPECSRVLNLASVLGREFELQALARAAELSLDDLLGVLDEAIEEGVVNDVPGSGGRLRFSHGLVRETIYGELPAGRRLRLHGQIGSVLEVVHAQELELHLAELAQHFFAAAPSAGVDKAIEYTRRAGDRAASLLAYEEAVRLYELALTLVAGGVGRCELLLALGDAQGRAGDTPASQLTFREAAELAEALRLPEHLARAALGYGGRFVWEASEAHEQLASLLEAALASLGEGEEPLRVRLLARLAAGPLRRTGQRATSMALSSEALALARRAGDPATLAYALLGYLQVHQSPRFTRERLELAEEAVRAAIQAGDKERAADVYEIRIISLIELGELSQAQSELAAMARLAAELRQPSHHWLVAVYRALLALLEGDLARAEALIAETHSLGERAQSWNAALAFRFQLYALRCDQGRPEDAAELVSRSVEEYSRFVFWRCAHAHVAAWLGRGAEARRAFDGLAADDFAGPPVDDDWLVSMSLLAETASLLGERERAAILYERLSPYAGRIAVAIAACSRGSVARYLGILATTMERWEDAERHFEDALETNERIGAPTWIAHTQRDYAGMFIARDRPGDAERAVECLETCIATARRLGMAALERDASELAAR